MVLPNSHVPVVASIAVLLLGCTSVALAPPVLFATDAFLPAPVLLVAVDVCLPLSPPSGIDGVSDSLLELPCREDEEGVEEVRTDWLRETLGISSGRSLDSLRRDAEGFAMFVCSTSRCATWDSEPCAPEADLLREEVGWDPDGVRRGDGSIAVLLVADPGVGDIGCRSETGA